MPNVLIRDLPEDVHASLQRRAKDAGQSLQQYLTSELSLVARSPSMAEVLDRVSERSGGRIGFTAATDDLHDERAPVIVVDASVLANVVGDDETSGERARARLRAASAVSAPDLVDVETVSVLRRRWLGGDLSAQRFQFAIDDLLAMPIRRFPVGPLMPRAFELRANVSAYDACYVALAEILDCPLITSDRRLANAPTITCTTELLHL